MAATAITDKFVELKPTWVGKVGAGGVASAGATVVPASSVIGLTNGNVYYITVNRTDPTGTRKNATTARETFKGKLSGTDFIECVRGVEGVAQAWEADTVLEILVTAAGYNEIIEGIELEHNQDGTHDTTKVVDLTTAQVLTNKDLTDSTNTFPSTVVDLTTAQVLTNKDLTSPTNSLPTFADGNMINGKIVPSVTSNNLTVALKGLNGSDPSASNPVTVRIDNVDRTITSALSLTINAGTNWFNAGSAELASKEIDYFVYLCWNTAADPDEVSIGISRIPYGTLISDFSGTTTNDKHIAISTAATATDSVVVIGRFAATLSGGAGYNWTVPTFTNKNLIQRPIYETRLLSWLPAISGTGSMTATLTGVDTALYKITGNLLYNELAYLVTTGGTASYGLLNTLPMSRIRATNGIVFGSGSIGDGGAAIMVQYAAKGTSTTQAALYKYNTANYALIAVTVYGASGTYSI